MKFALIALITCLTMTAKCYGQDAPVDTVAIKQFIVTNQEFENKFIAALKSKDINKCLACFTDDAIKNFGREQLVSELNTIADYYEDQPKPDVSYSVGMSSNGVGTFGHDVNSSLELECYHCFRNRKGKALYFFYIYYSNSPPSGLIKNISTQASLKRELGIRPL